MEVSTKVCDIDVDVTALDNDSKGKVEDSPPSDALAVLLDPLFVNLSADIESDLSESAMLSEILSLNWLETFSWLSLHHRARIAVCPPGRRFFWQCPPSTSVMSRGI